MNMDKTLGSLNSEETLRHIAVTDAACSTVTM